MYISPIKVIYYLYLLNFKKWLCRA